MRELTVEVRAVYEDKMIEKTYGDDLVMFYSDFKLRKSGILTGTNDSASNAISEYFHFAISSLVACCIRYFFS